MKINEGSNYHPQTKFAKVMFLYLSVNHSVHRGVSSPDPGGRLGCLAGEGGFQAHT